MEPLMSALPRNPASKPKLRVLHVLRAPVGGLFRHVVDLAHEQVARGHAVGLVVDSLTGGDAGEATLKALEPLLELGLLRLPMRRLPDFGDIRNTLQVALHARKLDVDVIHAHGSKGGVYARLPGFFPGFGGPIRVYTPHGGSFNYPAHPLVKKTYMAIERLLVATTDLFLLESHYIGRRLREELGEPHKLVHYVVNGLKPEEFVPVVPNADAADFLYIGELREAKGVDTLIDGFALMVERRRAQPGAADAPAPRLVLVGSGTDRDRLVEQAANRNVSELITFAGALPARQAFKRGRILVVPSRADSLPYVVIEGAGAQIPMIATNVGGIGEIVAPYRDRLIACNNVEALAEALAAALARPYSELQAEAAHLAAYVAPKFTIEAMVNTVLSAYAEAITLKHPGRRRAMAAFGLPSH
jgi:glycosyltransferase involved in cell wall biosynthesis